MKLFKRDNINDYIIPKDLSIGATGMLNSLLVRTNDELENTDLYSLSNGIEAHNVGKGESCFWDIVVLSDHGR